MYRPLTGAFSNDVLRHLVMYRVARLCPGGFTVLHGWSPRSLKEAHALRKGYAKSYPKNVYVVVPA